MNFRLPRLLRFYHMGIFFDRLDASLPYPVAIRLVRTINTMVFLIHIFTCCYFLYSDMEGLDTSSFVYNGYGHAYIRCFYVAMKTQIRDHFLQIVVFSGKGSNLIDWIRLLFFNVFC